MRTLIIFFCLLMLSCGSDPQNESSTEPRPNRTLDYIAKVTFLDEEKKDISIIDVAIADTPETRQVGLMDVFSMPEDKGMIFIFERQDNLRFWMANTPLPLDIIFVNENMQIVRIHRNVRPFSTQGVESGVPALYTVEVNAGFTAKFDIQEGMYISFTTEINSEN